MKEQISNMMAVTGKEKPLRSTNRYLRVHLNLLCHGANPLSYDKDHSNIHVIEKEEDKS